MPRAAQTFDYLESDTTIYKRDLRRFFVELRKQAHHIYALLCEAPKSVFWIVQENDNIEEDEPNFSIREFYASVGKFHRRKDTFRVYFNAYFFRDEWDSCVPCWDSGDNPFNGEAKYEINDTSELSVEVFEKEWPHLLAFICRKSILENAPFKLDRETIKRYKFSYGDVTLLREAAIRCNGRLIAELREQYDKLAAIDCLHERPKVKRERKSAAAPAPVKKERTPRKRIMRKVPYTTRL